MMNFMERKEMIWLEGGDGADYFDCGDSLDVIVYYDPSKGDTHTNNVKM